MHLQVPAQGFKGGLQPTDFLPCFVSPCVHYTRHLPQTGAAKAGNQEHEPMEVQLARARAWPGLQPQHGQERSTGHARKGWESWVGSE